ncbi:MAG: hypothetical protein HY315_03500 [Acidobacteria bacterium]|nr:hypothetical protein [Acidobacteriota bacterium]
MEKITLCLLFPLSTTDRSPLPPDCPAGWNSLLADRETGAHALAVRALDLACSRPTPLSKLASCFRQLALAHPSMLLLENLEREISKVKSRRQFLRARKNLKRSNRLIARNFCQQLRRRFPRRADLNILTLSRSSTVLSALLRARGRLTQVHFARSLPLGEGYAACRDARAAGLPAAVFDDARLRAEVKRCDLAVVGADAVLKNGSVVNKVGTHALAALCGRLEKPFWVLTSGYKFSDRAAIELFQTVGRRKVKLFDVTPRRLIEVVVTEEEKGSL